MQQLSVLKRHELVDHQHPSTQFVLFNILFCLFVYVSLIGLLDNLALNLPGLLPIFPSLSNQTSILSKLAGGDPGPPPT